MSTHQLNAENYSHESMWQLGMPINTQIEYDFYPRKYVEKEMPKFLNPIEYALKGVVTGLSYDPDRNLWLGTAAIAPVLIHSQASTIATNAHGYEFKLPDYMSHETGAAFSTLSMDAWGGIETISFIGKQRPDSNEEARQKAVSIVDAIARRLAHATEKAGYGLVMDEFGSEKPSYGQLAEGVIDLSPDSVRTVTMYGKPIVK